MCVWMVLTYFCDSRLSVSVAWGCCCLSLLHKVNLSIQLSCMLLSGNIGQSFARKLARDSPSAVFAGG